MRVVLCLLLLSSVCEAADSIVEELRKSPGVAEVSQPVTGERFVIHVRDWHWVPFEYLAAELPADTASENLARAYVEHLDEVRTVQQEQFLVLQSLADGGVTTVFREGLTPDIEPVFPAASRALWCRHSEIPEIGDELFKTPNVLSLGSPGRLLAKGHVKQVYAADTDATLKLTNPLKADGRLLEVPSESIEKREDHIVRQMLNTGQTAVVVLGGAHDLTDNVKRLSNGNTGLIVVTTRAFRKLDE